MRNMSAPHRSHSTLSSLDGARDDLALVERSSSGVGCAVGAGGFSGTGLLGSGMEEDYKLNSMDPFRARARMVAAQIVARGVRNERVLEALREVPRHLFVPEHVRHEAYEDRPLPIGEGQTISQPYIVASMTAGLAPGPADRVLEIGTGSGYQAAILARLAISVITVERQAALAARASDVLAALGVSNVQVIIGDGTEGYVPGAPYDRILVAAGAPAVPETLKAQLADGGRLVIPVGPSGFQHMILVERRGDAFIEHEGEGCVFVPLIGRYGWPVSHPDR